MTSAFGDEKSRTFLHVSSLCRIGPGQEENTLFERILFLSSPSTLSFVSLCFRSITLSLSLLQTSTLLHSGFLFAFLREQ